MEQNDEKLIREKTRHLVTDWAALRQPVFKGTTRDFADAVAVAQLVLEEAGSNLRQWVSAARRAGVSWLEIGTALGISKQAAQQRYGAIVRPAACPAEAPHRGIIQRSAGTAEELALLRREGARGHELVDATEVTLFFRRTRSIWEYTKALEASLDAYRLSKDGWVCVRSIFPFSYFKRVVS